MNSTHIISQDVFDKIRSRFTNLEMGDEQGEITSDPKEARFFDFDYVVEGNNLGRVSISINETGALKLFYSQGILESTDEFIHQLWYDFLREMRMFAKRRLLRFDTRDITKSNLNKDDFQYLANTGSKDNNMNMSESAKFEGGKMTSRRVLEKAVLIAKHNTPISDESRGARSRKNNIKALYIENAEGERYKFPFIYIAGAKAMQRHVANGGRPYDEIGQHIVEMCENIAQLTAFKRHVGSHDGMNQEVNEIVEKSNAKLVSLRRQMESICGQGGYENWTAGAGGMSSVGGDGLEMDQATMENYKSKFTVNSFKEDLAQYFPLIHSIMQEAGTVELEDYMSEGNDEDQCDVCENPVEKCTCDDSVSEERTEVKDKDGKVVSWKDEGEWTKSTTPKDGRGKVTNMSDKARRETEKLNKEGVNFSTFEQWVDRVAEGRLEPDTIMDLKDLLDSGLTLDVDGQSAIDALQGIGVHDEELENQLKLLSDPEQGGNPKNDPKDTILKWLANDDPEAAQELGYAGQKEPTADEDSMDGDDKKQEIEKQPTPKEVAEMVFSMYNRDHKEQGLGPFPRGEEGVITHVTKELGDRAGVMAKKLVEYLSSGHETEGMAGAALGGVAGAVVTKSPAGAMAGADIGSEIQDKLREAVEDRTSYQVARYMFDKGIRYSPENEKHIISKMDDAMKKLGMDHKQIHYHLSYEEDFIADTLGELKGMESAIDELATGNPMPDVVEGPGDEPVYPDDNADDKQWDDLDEVMRLAGIQQEGLKDIAKKVGGAVKAGAKAVGKAITGPDDDELLTRLEKETGGKRPNAYNKPKNEDIDLMLKLAGMAK